MTTPENGPSTCDASQYIMCMTREIAIPDEGVDHIDALGYSGAAFRIHTLPRQVLCPSTVSPRYGYKISGVDAQSRAAVSALRQAHKLAVSGQFGEYVSGQAAYDLWISLLEAEEGGKFLQEQEKAHAEDSGLPVMNAYCFQSLVHARKAAGPFLRRRASELDGAPARFVVQAAECYDRVAASLSEVGRPVWEPEARRKQAVVLREAKEVEAEAAALIGKALKELGDAERGAFTND